MELDQLKNLWRDSRSIRLAAGAAVLLAAAATASIVASLKPDAGSTLSEGPRVTAPVGVRIKVQLLNATKTRGLASRATRYLRDRGFDVVEVGNDAQLRDATVVYDRSGRLDLARLVARALGVARVESRPDSTRFVDVTVLLGADWGAPPGALRP